jgi:hypothetical protein
MKMSEIDVEELPQYVEAEPETEGSSKEKEEKIAIKVRQFAGQEPTIVWINPEWTVAEVEKRLARAWNKNPRATRLCLDGDPLPKNARFSELQHAQGKILDTVPEHGVGA